MKALIKKESKVGIWMEDVPVPTYGENEVLIKPYFTSICGTDIHIYKWDEWAQKTVPVPMVVGHEFVGEIVEIGSKVTSFKVGDIVSGEGHLTCGTCRNCRMGRKHVCVNVKGFGYDCPGCFAELFNLPEENVFLIPKEIPLEVASILDPLGNATHTALSFDLVGEDVLITGSGPMGLMSTAIAKHAGARYIVVTDVNDYRLDLAKKMGATRTVNVTKESVADVMKSLGIDEGFTRGFEMSGHSDGLNDQVKYMQHGGQIGLLGILPPGVTVDWNRLIFKMLVLKGIYGREIFDTWYKMTHMLQSGLNIAPVITHKFPISDFQKGFDAMLSGNSGKVILDWRS